MVDYLTQKNSQLCEIHLLTLLSCQNFMTQKFIFHFIKKKVTSEYTTRFASSQSFDVQVYDAYSYVSSRPTVPKLWLSVAPFRDSQTLVAPWL